MLVALGLGLSPARALAFSATSAEQRCYGEGNDVRLTFDDSADPGRMNTLLDILKAKNVRAGFFPIGGWAARTPDVMNRIAGDGHWIGNHTATHRNLQSLPDDRMRAEIRGGVAADLLRPPYGAFDNRVRRIAKEMGYRMCVWSTDTRDWSGLSAAQIKQRALTGLRPGGVVLMHMWGPHTLEALPELIDEIRARGMQLEPMQRFVGAAATTSGSTMLVDHYGEVVAEKPEDDRGSVARSGERTVKATAVVTDPLARGYWIATGDGRVFAFGGAPLFGSARDIALNAPIVGMAAKPDGTGYWLVGSDGGVLSFGGASFYGSIADVRLNRPVVGMVPTPSGLGYWLVGGDGGVFRFGDAGFFGSLPALGVEGSIVAGAASPTGRGYWLAGRDGGVFALGDATFRGSYPQLGQPSRRFLSIAALRDGTYVVISDEPGKTYRF